MEPVFPLSSPGSACPFGRAPGKEGGAELAEPDPTEKALSQPDPTEKALAEPDTTEKALAEPDPEEKAPSQPDPAEHGNWQQQINHNTDKPQHKAKS